MTPTDMLVAGTLDGAAIGRLNANFEAFTRASKELETAYERLRRRADDVDARLRESNQRVLTKSDELDRVTGHLHGVLDAIPSGVVATDTDGFVVSVNRAAERLLGRPARELVGRDVRVLRGRDGSPLLRLAAADPADVPAERDFESLEGARRRVVSTVSRLADGGRIEVLNDLTEVAHLRTQLNRLDTLAALGEMAAGIAHEVRNPLNGISGFAALLERAFEQGRAGDADTRRCVERIRKGVGDVDAIITSLLMWARPERLSKTRFDLRDLVVDAVAELGVVEGIETVLPSYAVSVDADRTKLRIVLGNLLRNAREAAGEAGRVRIGTHKDGDAPQIVVEDSGPGISAEARARLFVPFATTKPRGTGLGLAIARKLTEVHGGELALRAGSLGGARFVVILPAEGGVA